ncbi:hypothetical protein BJP40_25265 [Streptomyces sp. CC53]|uniref:hypothetical protein n=1 Tax=unclassified Streptomyces TaxID=2593676 RepID=UPI0008DD33DB|nr:MULTISPECIES: hypothetical protein [unclassified Streptomyces]OII63307.1 hypothetical protein BJP40_25265 [Streptomyces sp. CC53]
MDTVTRAAWETAVVRLLDDVYVFAATGPRTHQTWRDDALAVMRREAQDPRGWTVLDGDRYSEERIEHGPFYPFLALSPDALAKRLNPVTPDSAEGLLVLMVYEWMRPPEEEPQQARGDARTVLSRYGDRISCYTNVTAARTTTTPDLSEGVPGWAPLTDFVGDFGVVVVSATEVGVFWSFNPI